MYQYLDSLLLDGPDKNYFLERVSKSLPDGMKALLVRHPKLELLVSFRFI